MKVLNRFSLAGMLLAFAALAGCDKNKPYETEVPPPQAHFVGSRNQLFAMTTPNEIYNIVVGATDVTSEARTVTYKMESLSGATPGTEFSIGISGTTLTIPAGESRVNIPVQGNIAYYSAGEKDTLLFTLQEPSMKIAGFQDTVRLVLRGPCFDGIDIEDGPTMEAQLGNYNNSFDDGFGAYGPYTTSIKSITVLTPTTARAVINNVWDYGFGDINFIIDWTNTSDVTINVEAPVITGGNAGALNSAYNGMNLVIRKYPDLNGQFSVCSGIHTLSYQLGVYNPANSTLLGYFGNIGVTILEK